MGLFSALLGNAGAVRRQELQKLNKSVNVYDVQKILAHHVLQGLRIFTPPSDNINDIAGTENFLPLQDDMNNIAGVENFQPPPFVFLVFVLF